MTLRASGFAGVKGLGLGDCFRFEWSGGVPCGNLRKGDGESGGGVVDVAAVGMEDANCGGEGWGLGEGLGLI